MLDQRSSAGSSPSQRQAVLFRAIEKGSKEPGKGKKDAGRFERAGAFLTVRFINADVMSALRHLPDESVHCVVTSPPYWGLRDYGIDGQIGLERTLGEHIDRMVEVFREVRRVLRSDGTLWLNYGDCYATAPNGRKAADIVNDDRTFRDKPFSTVGAVYDPSYEKTARAGKTENFGNLSAQHGGRVMAAGGYLKPKDLCMIPHRMAIALQQDGWWVRADVVWAKPNPMPESITDRPTKSHEYVFLLTKAERYYYDAEAIKEPANYPNGANSPQSIKSPYGQGFTRAAQRPTPAGVQHKQNAIGQQIGGTLGSNDDWGSRNKRSVWTIATSPFPEAHFATFPPELPEICIKAGTSQHGCCAKCGAPWERHVEKMGGTIGKGWHSHEDDLGRGQRGGDNGNIAAAAWKTYRVVDKGFAAMCDCDAAVIPCTVLDPFAGAGTTCLVADRLQRNAIGIELNPEYAAMAERRLSRDRGGLLDLMEAAE